MKLFIYIAVFVVAVVAAKSKDEPGQNQADKVTLLEIELPEPFDITKLDPMWPGGFKFPNGFDPKDRVVDPDFKLKENSIEDANKQILREDKQDAKE